MYSNFIFTEERLGIKLNALKDEKGIIWFIGKEVASVLDYVDTKKAIQRHVDEEDKKILTSGEIITCQVKKIDFRVPNNGMKIVNERGCYCLIQNSQKISSYEKQVLIEMFNKITGKENTIVVSSRFEISFGEKLKNTLKPLNLKVETQKPMFDGKYRIDFYLPEFNLAIEYDEKQHQQKENKIKDRQREEEIKEVLGCKFIRLDYKQDDNYNIGLVLKEIMGR